MVGVSFATLARIPIQLVSTFLVTDVDVAQAFQRRQTFETDSIVVCARLLWTDGVDIASHGQCEYDGLRSSRRYTTSGILRPLGVQQREARWTFVIVNSLWCPSVCFVAQLCWLGPSVATVGSDNQIGIVSTNREASIWELFARHSHRAFRHQLIKAFSVDTCDSDLADKINLSCRRFFLGKAPANYFLARLVFRLSVVSTRHHLAPWQPRLVFHCCLQISESYNKYRSCFPRTIRARRRAVCQKGLLRRQALSAYLDLHNCAKRQATFDPG